MLCAQSFRPHVVVLDVMMPGMDGLEACREIKKAMGPSVSVILLTAKGEVEDRIRGLETGAATELVKQASAQSHISADDPPFFIQHGTADRNIPITQSMNFAAELTSVLGAGNVTFTQLEGAGHGTAEFMTEENVAGVLDFLDSVLK